jgi:hypothetical protein
MLAGVGAASVALEVVTTTVLQRRIPRESLASAEGVSTSAVFAGLLVGATLAPVLIGSLGLSSAMGIATAGPTVLGYLAIVRWRRPTECRPTELSGAAVAVAEAHGVELAATA